MKGLSIVNKSGKRLSALISRPSQTPSPVVVVCHGFKGSKESHGKAFEMADLLAERGFACLLFDFAGCGESEGNFEDISLSGHISDLECVVDFAVASGFGPIITMGRSFGGSTVLCHAASDSRVDGVCAWAAPVSLTELFLGFTDEDLPEGEDSLVTISDSDGILYLKKSFFSDLRRHDVARCSSLISPRPLMIFHGTMDSVVPPADGELIYRSAGKPKDIAFIEGADHLFSNHYRELWEMLFQWLQKYFPQA
ncbi:MAG: alpha/beta hydrolase [Bacillota bacterium]